LPSFRVKVVIRVMGYKLPMLRCFKVFRGEGL